MIEPLEALLLGLLQGVTEFLPISSSGHLVLAQHLMGWTEPAVLFDVVLHVGTLVAVVAYYRRDLRRLLAESLAAAADLGQGKRASEAFEQRSGAWLSVLIVVGTVPTVILGFAFEDLFERLFSSLFAVGVALIGTGCLLVVTRLAIRGTTEEAGMRIRDALLIGLAQGLAITPGVSRSGTTIAVALLLGVERTTAARYSFLLSLPAILGALVLQLRDVDPAALQLGAFGVGLLAAVVSGYACLALLVRLVRRGHFDWFAPYCWAVGLFALWLART